MRKSVRTIWGAGIAVAAVVSGCVVTGNIAASTPTADAPKAVLLSAAGNVVGQAGVMQTAAIVYMDIYQQKSACQARVKQYLATGKYTGGGCTVVTSGAKKGWWQVYLDDPSFCYDRVAPTNVTALALPTLSRLAA